MIVKIGDLIANGASEFLHQEYRFLAIFMTVFGVIILFAVDIFGPKDHSFRCHTTAAFFVGALTSTISGYIGM